MTDTMEVYNEMKEFVGFTDETAALLVRLQPMVAKHGGGITDRFYDLLGKYPKTAAQIEGRVDALKATHKRWMAELVGGDYGEDYFNSRLRIGLAHVRINLDPYYVEGVVTHLRNEGAAAIAEEFAGDADLADLQAAWVKALDIDLLVINLAYAEERLDRLTKFTGMRRRLIERCIQRGG